MLNILISAKKFPKQPTKPYVTLLVLVDELSKQLEFCYLILNMDIVFQHRAVQLGRNNLPSLCFRMLDCLPNSFILTSNCLFFFKILLCRNHLVAVLSNCALDSSFVFNPVMGSSLIQQISLLRLCLWRSKSISVRKIIYDYTCMFFIQDTRINLLTGD